MKRLDVIREMPARAQVRIDRLLEQGREKEAQKIVDAWYLRRKTAIPPLRQWSHRTDDDVVHAAGPTSCPSGAQPYWWYTHRERVAIFPACFFPGKSDRGVVKGWIVETKKPGHRVRYVREHHAGGWTTDGDRRYATRFSTPHEARASLIYSYDAALGAPKTYRRRNHKK